MNIEGGTVSAGRAAISAGPAMGSAVSVGTIEVGPVGGFSPSFVNEGPVDPSFLENTILLSMGRFDPAGEIIFNPNPAIIAQAVVPSEIMPAEIIPFRYRYSDPVSLIARSAPATDTEKKMKLQFEPQKKQAYSLSEPQSAPKKETQLEQVGIEVLLDEKRGDIKEMVDEEKSRKRYLEDESTKEARIYQLRQAIFLASQTERFNGEIIKSFMPEENDNNRSEALRVDDPQRRYPDGGYLRMLEDIGLWGELISEQEALNKAKIAVEENGPVKKGQAGHIAPIEHVWRAYERFPVKPAYETSLKRRSNAQLTE